MDDGDFVVCVRWGRQSVLSEKRRCSECRRPVAVSKNVARQLPKGAKPLCEDCALPRIARDPDPEMKLAPGAETEVLTWLLSRGRQN